MKCEEIYDLVVEEAEAMEVIYGVALISGITVDNKFEVAKFISINFGDLLRPLVTSIFVPKHSGCIEKVCGLYSKKCIRNQVFWLLVYSKDRVRIYFKNITRSIFRYRVV